VADVLQAAHAWFARDASVALCPPFLASVLAFFAGNGLYHAPNPLFYIFPGYSVFNIFGQILMGTLVSGKDVLVLSLYAVDFVILMLIFCAMAFPHQGVGLTLHPTARRLALQRATGQRSTR